MPAEPRAPARAEATAPYARAYAAGLRRAHLIPEGSPEALCGARPRKDGKWHVDGDHAAVPDCAGCAARVRITADIAAWDGKPGTLPRVAYASRTAVVSECARCTRVRPLPCRGLCWTCIRAATADGTLAEYGWTYADRLAEYAQMRANRVARAECARRLGVCDRTATRYEKALADAGQAPWRHAP